MMDSNRYWVGFNLVKGIGAIRFKSLLDHFGSAERAWQAPADVLAQIGLPQKALENLLILRNKDDLDQVWERITEQKIKVLTLLDDDYPPMLKEIAVPPPVLYIRGTLDEGDRFSVAIVGTRRMTNYGHQVTQAQAAHLAANNVTVVSGLARGVDAVAHKAALDAGGRTIAVLGSGVDVIYPSEHRKLAQEIVANGAIISDYAPGTPPEGVNFPPRNRIISGLSMAIIVVEAGERSGALITANFAAEQGREVYAVPGNIDRVQSKGTNALIRQGARPLLNKEEVLGDLSLNQVSAYRQAHLFLPENGLEAELFELVKNEPLHIDEICSQSSISVDRVTASLVMMELKGLVRQVDNMRYQAIGEERSGYQTSDREGDSDFERT
jgi:DNA processing protein